MSGFARRVAIKSSFYFHKKRMRPLAEDSTRLPLDGFITHVDRVFRVYTTLNEFMYFVVGGEYSQFLGFCGVI